MPTILIIDDDRGIRVLLEDVLSDAGYEVIAAGSAREALGVLEAVHPDVILLDLSVPEGEEELNRVVASLIDGTKLVVISGSSELQARAMDLGAHDTIGKPFEIDELLLAVRRLSEGETQATGSSSAA